MRQFLLLGVMVAGALAVVYVAATVIEISQTRGHHTEYEEASPPR